MNIFDVRETPWDGADCDIRKALSACKIEHPAYIKMEQVIKATKVKYVARFWKEHAWAHFGFPAHKKVVVLGQSVYWIRARLFFDKWRPYGFKVLPISLGIVMTKPVPFLVGQLAEALTLEDDK